MNGTSEAQEDASSTRTSSDNSSTCPDAASTDQESLAASPARLSSGQQEPPARKSKDVLGAILHHLRVLDPELAARDQQEEWNKLSESILEIEDAPSDLERSATDEEDVLDSIFQQFRVLDPELAATGEEERQAPSQGKKDSFVDLSDEPVVEQPNEPNNNENTDTKPTPEAVLVAVCEQLRALDPKLVSREEPLIGSDFETNESCDAKDPNKDRIHEEAKEASPQAQTPKAETVLNSIIHQLKRLDPELTGTIGTEHEQQGKSVSKGITPDVDPIQSVARSLVLSLRHLDPELARLDEEAYQRGELDPNEHVQQVESFVQDLVHRAGSDSSSFVEHSRVRLVDTVESCRTLARQEIEVCQKKATEAAVLCKEQAAQLVRLLDPELAARDEMEFKKTVPCYENRQETKDLAGWLEETYVVEGTQLFQKVETLVNHCQEAASEQLQNLEQLNHRETVDNRNNSLEVMKQSVQDWQTNVASLSFLLQHPLPGIQDTQRIERQLQFAVSSYLNANETYQAALQGTMNFGPTL